MPYLFSRHTLHELDAAEYEGAPLVSQVEAPGPGEAAELELAERVNFCSCTANGLFVHMGGCGGVWGGGGVSCGMKAASTC